MADIQVDVHGKTIIAPAPAAAGPFNPRTIFDPQIRPDPYSVYSAAREAGALIPISQQSVMATRMAECAAVLSDASWGHGYTERMNPFRPGVGADRAVGSFLIMDPPDHTRLRRAVSKAFMRRLNMSVKPRVEQIVDDLLDVCIEKNEVDMVGDFAAPLVRTVACEIVGVPVSDYPTYRQWSAAIVRGVDPDSLLAQHEIVARYAAEDSFMEYFTPMVKARRESPGDDLLSDIIALEREGQGISEEELLKIFAMLMIATHETTVNALGNMMISLCRYSTQRNLVCAGPELLVPAIEECLRFDPPVQFTSRVALKEVELGGRTFAPGDGVVVLIASANHDEAVYTDSDAFDVTRFYGPEPAERHIAFSLGHHFCLGAPLARIELETALRMLLQRAPRYAMLNDTVSYRKTHTFRGPAELPVRLRP